MKSKPKTFAAKKKTPKAAPKDTPVRKIVQIQVLNVGPSTQWVALCDDGTLWAGLPGNWAQANVDMIIYNPPPPPPAEAPAQAAANA
jgi:hypothetical protein